jgi:hypothetical protein
MYMRLPEAYMHTPYMNVNLEISEPKRLCIHHIYIYMALTRAYIYMALANARCLAL